MRPATGLQTLRFVFLILIASSVIQLHAYAQRRYKFRTGASAGVSEDPNVFSGRLAVGGLGLGYAIGIEYERFIDRAGTFSISLQAVLSKSRDQILHRSGDDNRVHHYQTFFIAPGAFFHPAGGFQRCDFGIGAQLAAGPLSTREVYFHSGSTDNINYSSFFIAPMAAINLNIRGRNGSSIFGWNFAAGPALNGEYGLDYNSRSIRNLMMVQIGIRIGVRFSSSSC